MRKWGLGGPVQRKSRSVIEEIGGVHGQGTCARLKLIVFSRKRSRQKDLLHCYYNRSSSLVVIVISVIIRMEW